MPEPMYSILRVLHPGGMFLAFAVAPIALLSIKGEHRHVIAGRCFAVGMLIGAVAGFLLATVRSEPVVDLTLLGLLTFFFVGTGYLAPRIARGSWVAYRWDRVLTVVGLLASLALIATGAGERSLGMVLEGVVVGGFGLWVSVGHWRWRGPAEPHRWRVQHLTSLMAAWLIVWWFIFWLYIHALPPVVQTLIPAVLGIGSILWARRRFALAGGAGGPPVWPGGLTMNADQPHT